MSSKEKDLRDLKALAIKLSEDPTTKLSSINVILKVINILSSGKEDKKFNEKISNNLKGAT